MFCSGKVIAAYTNTRMETLVLKMFDKVICTTNVKQQRFWQEQGIIKTCLKNLTQSFYTCNRMLSKHRGGAGRHWQMVRILTNNGFKSQLKQSWDGDSPVGTVKCNTNLMTALHSFWSDVSKLNGKRVSHCWPFLLHVNKCEWEN